MNKEKFHYAKEDEFFKAVASLHGIDYHESYFTTYPKQFEKKLSIIKEMITDDYSIAMEAIYDKDSRLNQGVFNFRLHNDGIYHYADSNDFFRKIAQLHGVEFDDSFKTEITTHDTFRICVKEKKTELFSLRMVEEDNSEYCFSFGTFFFEICKKEEGGKK